LAEAAREGDAAGKAGGRDQFLQGAAFRSVADDHEARRLSPKHILKGQDQPIQRLLLAQGGDGADDRPMTPENRRTAGGLAKARAGNAVGDVGDPLRRDAPNACRDIDQGLRRQYHGAFEVEYNPAEQNAAADLTFGFLRAETILDMNMTQPAEHAGGGPFHGAPVISHQRIGPEGAQILARFEKGGNQPALRRSRQESLRHVGFQKGERITAPIQGNDGVPITLAEMVGQRCEAALRPAQLERRENVDQMHVGGDQAAARAGCAKGWPCRRS